MNSRISYNESLKYSVCGCNVHHSLDGLIFCNESIKYSVFSCVNVHHSLLIALFFVIKALNTLYLVVMYIVPLIVLFFCNESLKYKLSIYDLRPNFFIKDSLKYGLSICNLDQTFLLKQSTTFSAEHII